jgi:hypothetical protein
MKTIDLEDGSQLLANVTADVFGREVGVTYRADLYTPAFLRQEGLTVPAAVAAIVTEWGITRGGVPVPPTEEGVSSLPQSIVGRVWDAIGGDFSTSPKWTSGSGSISTPVEPADAAR